MEYLDAGVALRKGDFVEDLILMLAVLCHDFGKPATTEVDEARGRIISHGHDEAGVEPARAFIRRMWGMTELDDVLPLVRRHMLPMTFVSTKVSDKAYRRLSMEVRSMGLLADVAECDLKGVDVPKESLERGLADLAEFRRRSESLHISTEKPKPLVLGRHLIDRGMEPGPKMKPILDKCFDAQLDGEFTDLEGGLKYLDGFLESV